MSNKSQEILSETNIVIFAYKNLKNIFFISLCFFLLIFSATFFIKSQKNPIYSLDLYINSEAKIVKLFNQSLARASAWGLKSELIKLKSSYNNKQLAVGLFFDSILSSYSNNNVLFEYIDVKTSKKFNSDYLKISYQNQNKISHYNIFNYDQDDGIKNIQIKFEKIISLVNSKLQDYYLDQLELFIYEINTLIEISEYIKSPDDLNIYSKEILINELLFVKNILSEFENAQGDLLKYNISKIEVEFYDKGIWRSIIFSLICSLFLSFSILFLLEFHKKIKTYLDGI